MNLKKIDSTQSAWYKKYMPQTVEDMILPQNLKQYIIENLKSDTLSHLGLFSLNPGTGKSSLATSILNDLAELDGEGLLVNASLDSGKGTLESKLAKFASKEAFSSRKKIVLMDEFDSFSRDGQLAFRGFIDEYSQNCVFIFTGNHKERIIEPLLDRMQVYDFQSFDKREMIPLIYERLVFILQSENIQHKPEDVATIINTFYPSIRSMVGALQKFSKDAVLNVCESELDNIDAFSDILKLIKSNNFQGVLEKSATIKSPDTFYTQLYDSIGLFPQNKQNVLIITIAKYQHMGTSVRDKNVNLSACLVEFMMILSQ